MLFRSEDMALEGVRSLDLTGLGQIESFLCAAMGFQLRHSGSPSVCCVLRKLFGILGAEEHGHIASFELRVLGDGGQLGTVRPEFLQQVCAKRGVRHLVAAETNGDLHSVAILQELHGVFDLGIKVVGIDARGAEDFPRIMDVLDKHKVKVTFFMTGGWVEDNPDCVKEDRKSTRLNSSHSH